VMGAGDKIPEALRQLGANVTLLTAEDLAAGDLGRFDAVVTGVRAANTRPDLLAARERVLEYVQNGGTLVVQYNTVSFRRSGPAGMLATALAPFPMTASRLRVTDERAPVGYPAGADHPLLRVPNRITRDDFEGWVQERGLYFMSAWDERYDAVLECSDKGEAPLAGGLLHARYGKGAYVFTGYSWFRQLPAGVPGAFRLFANLISAGKAR
ncbi:MAG: PIG-L family deacetylase, partial [Bryobacterales bacterium]|nr:PIG-L family deacetylase [Bryobacterales bacterium]